MTNIDETTIIQHDNEYDDDSLNTLDKILSGKERFLMSFGKIDDFSVFVFNQPFNFKKDYIIIKSKDNEYVGYIILNGKKILDHGVGFQIGSIFIKSKYRGNRIGIKLYSLLINNGYKILSGDFQTNNSRKIWKSLLNSNICDVYKTFEVLDGIFELDDLIENISDIDNSDRYLFIAIPY